MYNDVLGKKNCRWASEGLTDEEIDVRFEEIINEFYEEQYDKLRTFLMKEFPEFDRKGSHVDTAIWILERTKEYEKKESHNK